MPQQPPDNQPGSLPYRTPPADNAIATIIPYRNVQALVAYYLGIFSLIPFVGAFLGIAAVILGIRGFIASRRNPEAKGAVHAWVGIICGGLFGLIWILVDLSLIFAVVAAAMSPRGMR